MMSDWRDQTEPLILEGQIKLPYTWSVGETGSRFLVALRDEKKILGNRCPHCNKVYVPPRKNCGFCFKEIDEQDWVELSTEGIVTAYTIVYFSSPLQPIEPPFAYALIQLDGADVSLMHLIISDLDQLENGVRVKAKFAEKRKADILDIESFEIIREER
jgi:uncharacterized protein